MLFILCLFSSGQAQSIERSELTNPYKPSASLVVLGTVQDAGSPHAGCQKVCCEKLFDHPDPDRKVVSLGLIDNQYDKKYLFEATPDISTQMKALKNFGAESFKEFPDGIFMTHAHIGHYTGLMYLGKEALNSKGVIVYAMPKMKSFIENNGPWDQLVNNKNIVLGAIHDKKKVQLTDNLGVKPILVPHRDEYSETVGFLIEGSKKKALFIPDIDKWEKWDLDIIEMVTSVDYAFLDATFFDAQEINNRDIKEIPHPFIIESIGIFKSLSAEQKNKIYFIHMNHTNPALEPNSRATKLILDKGFNIARINDIFEL